MDILDWVSPVSSLQDLVVKDVLLTLGVRCLAVDKDCRCALPLLALQAVAAPENAAGFQMGHHKQTCLSHGCLPGARQRHALPGWPLQKSQSQVSEKALSRESQSQTFKLCRRKYRPEMHCIRDSLEAPAKANASL